MSEKSFRVHQTLHGYSDGHRLIRSSRDVPSSVERTMLVLSDMSGSSMVQGFENYITGYPLDEIKSYVFARTWYAPEMRRPGCVWTHSLLIDNSALAHITDFASLLPLFVRPSSERQSWDKYESILDVDPSDDNTIDNEFRQSSQLSLAQDVLSGLYGFPDYQVFLTTDKTSHFYEYLVMAIWSQQWARLRRSFSFCTGSMSDRKLPTRTFDLQIVPRSLQRDISLIAKNALFIQPNGSSQIRADEWLSICTADLIDRNLELQRFFRVFGVETLRGRADYIPLVELFLSVNSNAYDSKENVQNVIAIISDLFPSPSEGLQTKASFLGGEISRKGQIPNFLTNSYEALVLRELTKTKKYNAFDPARLMIEERAAKLLERDPENTKILLRSILESTELTPIGQNFIHGIFETMSGVDSYRFSDHEFEILLLLVRTYRSLGASPNVWRTTANQQKRILESLVNDLTSEEIHKMVIAMLRADSDAVITDLANVFPESTAGALLAWSRSASIDEVIKLSPRWLNVITKNSHFVMNSVISNDISTLSTSLLLVLALDPNSKTVSVEGSRLWISLAHYAPGVLQGNVLGRAMAFLLALGFSNVDNNATLLVEKSFALVHTSAEQHWLAENDWMLLRSHAPSANSIPAWDKCGRLRDALVEHYMNLHWPQQSLLRCLDDSDILQKVITQVLERGGLFNSQRGYLKKIAQQVFAGALQATKKQKRVLKNLK